jgi:hypothetical protein
MPWASKVRCDYGRLDDEESSISIATVLCISIPIPIPIQGRDKPTPERTNHKPALRYTPLALCGFCCSLLLSAALCCSLLLFGTPFHAHPRPPASNLHEQRARHMISMMSIEVQRIPLSLAFFPPPSLFVLGPLVRADSLLLRLFPSFLRLTSNLFSSPLNPLFSSRHLPFCILIQK